MVDRQDIEIASIFHLVELMLANVLGVKIWSNLSKGLKEIINTKVFKRHLITELICNMNQVRL